MNTLQSLAVAIRCVCIANLNPAMAPSKVIRDVKQWSRNRQADKADHDADGKPMTPLPVSALDTAGNPPPLVSPQETRRARETATYKRTIASRQNVDTQIKQLKSSINADLAYIRNCLNGGRKDKAVNQMIQVVRKQERLQELASKWASLMSAVALKQALERPPRPAKNRFERPVKRYKLFDRD